MTRRGWTIDYILDNLTLKQILMLYETYIKNKQTEFKEMAIINFLSTSAGFGSKEAFKKLQEIFGNEDEDVIYM